jgi:hypothetical protein
MSELERKAVVHAAWTAKPCCDLHEDDGCCDEDDCGPCCEGCPTCPTLRAKHRAEYEAIVARLEAATPEQRAEWARQAEQDEREATGGVDYVRYTRPDGSVRVDNTRLTDGRVMCCICFDYKWRHELAPVEDGSCGCAVPCVWNVCKPCMEREQKIMARMTKDPT